MDHEVDEPIQASRLGASARTPRNDPVVYERPSPLHDGDTSELVVTANQDSSAPSSNDVHELTHALTARCSSQRRYNSGSMKAFTKPPRFSLIEADASLAELLSSSNWTPKPAAVYRG